MTRAAISQDQRPTEPQHRRFIEHVMRDEYLETEVVKGFVGRRWRANRLLQQNEVRSHAVASLNHTLVYHIGGGRAERFSGRKKTGTSDKFGTSTLMPAHQEAAWRLPDGVDVLHLYLDDDELRHFAASEYGFDADRLEMRDYIGVDDPFMRYLGPLVLQELPSDLPQTHLMLNGFDAAIAGHMLRAYSNMSDIVLETEARERNHRDMCAVSAARDMLMDRLDENLTTKEIGKALDIDAFRLMRLFKRQVGLTMHQFVMQKRVAYVRDRLKNSDTRLIDIAYDAGFSSQAHMSTVYSKIMGISPGRHRMQLRK